MTDSLLQALKEIAQQKTSDELAETWYRENDETFDADFQTGYDACIGVARRALAENNTQPTNPAL